jgi:hypothetical protein
MKRIQKPIGIYAWVIFIVIAYGLFPLIGMFPISATRAFFVGVGALPYNGSIQMLLNGNGESNFVVVLISLFLCVFTVASAIWAWFGPNESRLALLTFLTLNFFWWLYLIVYAMTVTDDSSMMLELAISLIRPPIFLGVIWWYFTKKEVVAFYKQEQQ